MKQIRAEILPRQRRVQQGVAGDRLVHRQDPRDGRDGQGGRVHNDGRPELRDPGRAETAKDIGHRRCW